MWNLKNKVVVITGATNGIGKAALFEIAKHGPRLFITYRNKRRIKDLLFKLRKIDSDLKIELVYCDFSYQSSVRKCAKEINLKTKEIDVLINNAGVFNIKYYETLEGIENTFAVNHLGYFLFTNLLLNKMTAYKETRIINVASEAHNSLAKLNWKDMNFCKNYGKGINAYAQSKLSNLMFTRLLSLKVARNNISVNALDPGVISTGIGDQSRSFLGKIANLLLVTPFSKSSKDGAASIIYLSTEDYAFVTGEYFIDCKRAEASSYSHDLSEAKKLWDLSEKLVGEKFSF